MIKYNILDLKNILTTSKYKLLCKIMAFANQKLPPSRIELVNQKFP